jgi:FtsZ-binding cell division protein ZapB
MGSSLMQTSLEVSLSRLNKSLEKIEALQADIDQLRQRNHHLEQENSALRHTCQEMQGRWQGLQDQYNAYIKNRSLLSEKINNAMGLIKTVLHAPQN